LKRINISQIEGTEFPAGRRTRVIIGENGGIKETKFCQGYVEIFKGGSIPVHEHENAESYTILKGEGLMMVGEETLSVREGDCVFIEPGNSHSLKNTGDGQLHMMFVYAPGTIVDHWARESKGELV
jgi:mannose-6-phosphate isomerase-like protein (cupin superfamily)